MANVSELTLRVKVEGGSLKVLETGVKKVGDTAQSAAKKASSTFGQMNQTLDKSARAAFDSFSRHVDNGLKQVERLRSSMSGLILNTVKVGAVAATAFTLFSLGFLIRQGVQFNSELETSRIGIAAIVAATQDIRDETGRLLEGQEEYNAALVVSKGLQEELKRINLETSATSREIIQAFQAVSAPAAATGLSLQKTLEITKLLTQATKALGLEGNQVAQEGRDILSGSIDNNSQLAKALGITREQIEEAKEQGRLYDLITGKLNAFALAGEDTKNSWEGIKSNVQDALDALTGEAFEGIFDLIKEGGKEIGDSLISFEDGVAKVNPELLETGRIINDEIVYWIREGEKAAKDFVKGFDAGELRKNLNGIKLDLADFLDLVDGLIQFTRGDGDFVAYGVIGWMLFGPVGAIAGVFAGLYDDLQEFQGEMEKATQVFAKEALQVVETNNKRIRELQNDIVEAMKEVQQLESEGVNPRHPRLNQLKADIAVAQAELQKLYNSNQRIVDQARGNIESSINLLSTTIAEGEQRVQGIIKELQNPNLSEGQRKQLTDQYLREETILNNLKIHRTDLQGLLETYKATEEEVTDTVETQKGFMGETADRLRSSVEASEQIESYMNLIERYMSTIAPNSFTFAAGMTSALGATSQIKFMLDLMARANGGKGLTVTPTTPTGDPDPDPEAKKAARERERIEEQLKDTINRIVLDREAYERLQIQQTVESARKAGVDKELIARYLATKEIELEREKYDEFLKLLKERTDEQKKRNEEILEAFNDIRVDNLPESLKLSEQLETDLANIKKALDTRNVTFEQAEKERLLTVQRYTEQIAEARKQEYIESLKNSNSFYDQLKGGFLEFVTQVETNGELVSQFFANTLTSMSQSFSDLTFQLIEDWDGFKDAAIDAMKAILRSFLDMASAIATRQIVISIAGAFGADTKGAKATDVLGFGKDAVGLAGGAIGLGGAGAAAGAGLLASSSTLATASTGIPTFLMGTAGGTALATGGAGTGVLATIGAAAPYVGAVLAAAAIAYTVLGPLLKKTPRLDIDFDSVKTDLGRRAAVVEEFLDPGFFADNIGQVSVKRKAGLGVGGDDKILDLIRERIEETIEGIQDIIRKLPTDLFDTLNETLLSAEIDIDTIIGGERLLEFDAKGKKVAEKFQAFIEGELPAKFFLAIRESFFDPALEALGVSAEGTEKLIDKFLADMEAAGSREARAQIGAEFLATFNAFVDAFNIVSGNVNDAIGQTIQSIDSLSSELGFEAVPSIDELRSKLAELISEAEIDPEVVQQYADLRNVIVSAMSDIVSSITGLVGKINQLNQTIVSLGGSAVDTSGFLSAAADQLQSFLTQEMGNLSLGEQEAFLDQLAGVANEMLAQEMAAFEAQQAAAREAAEAAAEAQRQAIQNRIDGLGEEKNRIQEAYRARIDGLNEELRIAEGFKSLTQSIRDTLESIILGPESVLTGIEKVNFLQGEIGSLQRELANTTDPEKQLDIAAELRDAFSNLNSAAADAFGIGSPEFVAIFDQVTGGLESLAGLTEARARTVEEIQAEIERLTEEQNSVLEGIDAQIASLRESMTSIQAQNVEATFQASDRVKELFEYIRTEYTRILEERMDQLSEISETGFTSELEGLGAISGQFDSALVTLKDQLTQMEVQTDAIHRLADTVAGIPGFASGSGGVRDFGMQTLAFLHGKEVVLTEDQLRAMAQDFSAGMGLVEGLGSALTGSRVKGFADEVAGRAPISRLLRNIEVGGGSGAISELVAELEGRGRQGQGRNVTINIPITISAKASSAAADAALPGQIEELIVRSVRKGKVRKEIQKAAKETLS